VSAAVRKAVVLAAGFGTRLRPLTLETPKPLLPVMGEPMLERALRMLEEWGVEEIAVNAHHLSDKIEAYCKARKGTAAVRVSVEKEILGTGGALKPLKDFLGSDPFWLVNGDVVVEDVDPAPIRDAFERSGRFAACWLTEYGPRTVEPDPEGRICNWKSEEAGYPGTLTYSGVALLSPDVIGYLPETPFSSIVDAYEKAMMADAKFVVGVEEKDAFWCDAGTVDAYRDVNEGPQKVSLYGSTRLDALVDALGWDPEEAGGVFLSARGSDRAFWRLDRAGRTSVVGILYDDAKRPENGRYAVCARLLAKAGVPVPAVAADVPAAHALALEDLGDDSLEKRAAGRTVDRVKLYTPVVQALRLMHDAATPLALDTPLEPAFGPDLYAWERNLFVEHCVKGRYGLDALPADVEKELEGVAAELGRAMPVVVHRDFQSSNVLYRADGTFAFIDFQGMRLGPAVYDLASLLYDPYVDLSEKDRGSLRKVYGGIDARTLALGAVQRLVQALGAFGRLAAAGQPQFARHVPRALGNLLAAADEADLNALGGFVEDLIAKEEVRLGHFHIHDHDHDHEEDEA